VSIGRYILNGHEPVEEPDLLTWARWIETADRHVRDTFRDDVRVSTVFLGLDMNVFGGPPDLFETMVFVNGCAEDCDRYQLGRKRRRATRTRSPKSSKPRRS
jgi:hypothetical protein